MSVSLVKDTGRHRSERFTEALAVVFVTVDGCVLRQVSANGHPVQTHLGACNTEWIDVPA